MKKGRKIIITLIVIAVLFLIGVVSFFAIDLYVTKSTEKNIFKEDAARGTFDCILILGAGVRDDGTPSKMLEERLSCGLNMYEMGLSEKILVSGDHGRVEYDEVNTMKAWLMEKGVPSEDVFMDHAGFSTYDSIYRAKEVFCANSMLVVTQKYHLHRALYLCDSLGISAIGVDATKNVYYGQALRDIRESAARVKDFFNGIIKPKPKYLGDIIPVSENGDITNDKDI